MQPPVHASKDQGPWISLGVVALLSFAAQLALCGFFSFGDLIPISTDIEPSNLWKFGYHFPPQGSFLVLNWLGVANLPQPLNPFSLAANLPAWIFFTAYAPAMATLALLAMAAFLRELELPRPAALFGGVVYAWQGDLLPFVFPGHYAYIATWFFFAVAAWGALRAGRTHHWAYALISGAGCGLMVQLQPDRGAIASLLIAALYIAPSLFSRGEWKNLWYLTLCAGAALLISLAAFLALFQSNIVGVKLGGKVDREQTYGFVTQFSLGPEETLTYLVPGFFGWHSSHVQGPYWGRIGQTPGWADHHQGTRNFNLAISTTGTVPTALALLGACLLLPGRWFGPDRITDRQRFYGRLLLALGLVALVLAWGWHTPFYRLLFNLPLMDKWRNPLKWLEWTNFALAALSAFGVQQLMVSLDADAPDAKVVRRRLFWFTNGLLGLLGLGLLASYPFAIGLATNLAGAGYEASAIANVMGLVHWSLLVALALMALFALLLYSLWRPERLRDWTLDINPLLHRLWQTMLRPDYLPLTLTLGLAALGTVQLGWVATQFVTPIDARFMTETNPLLDELRSEGSAVRVSLPMQDGLLNVLLQNQFAADRISCLEISAASRIPDDFNAFINNFNDNKARLWLLAGVKNVVVPQEMVPQLKEDPSVGPNIDRADGYMLMPTSSPDLPSHALVVMRDYLAKATLVPGAEVLPSDKAVLKRLRDPAWNPRATVLLGAPSPPPGPHGGPSTGKTSPPIQDEADLKTYTPQEIEVEAKSAQGGYLLINDQYDPDWQARVNGHDTPLLRADYILRAISVPAGSSTITMHYVPHYRVGGLNLPATATNIFSDVAMLAAWIIAGLALWRRKKQAA